MTEFRCAVDEGYHSACEDLPEYQDTRYCVLHFPDEDKKEAFGKALDKKLKDGNFNFAGVFFPGDQSFESCKFGSKANFSNAIFRGTVDFYKATFEVDAYFNEATFHREANFVDVTFEAEATARFFGTTFKGSALFWRAQFNKNAYFTGAKFLERTRFSAPDKHKAFNLDGEVNFDYVEIEKPELFQFRSLKLRSGWVLYVDELERLYFHNVIWKDTVGRPKLRLKEEAEALGKRESRNSLPPHNVWKTGIDAPYLLLATTYRELHKNYEEKRDYPTANEFHYLSMEALRKGDRPFDLIRTLYWVLSGYGVRPLRAFVVLIIMSLVFALLYSVPAIGAAYSLQAFEGLTSGNYGLLDHIGYFLRTEMYSLGALSRLNPEPKPTPGLFQTLVIIEGILGPLQIALLALAIRRKVMR